MSNLRAYCLDKYEDELQEDFSSDDYYIFVAEKPSKLPTYVLIGEEDEDTAAIFSAYDIGADDKVGLIFKRRIKYIMDRANPGNINPGFAKDTTITSVIAEELINQYAEGDPIEDFTDLVSGATITIDVGAGKKNRVTLAENTEISFTNVGEDDAFFARIEQDDGGSNTVTWADDITWLTDNELKSGANEVTVYGFIRYDVGKYYGFKLGETQ
jgi:hypothetical protein